MTRRRVWLGLLAPFTLSFAAVAQAPRFEVSQYRLEGGAFQPAWFVCDDSTTTTVVIASKASDNSVRLEWFSQLAPATRRVATYRSGRADGAAGSVYYGLEVAGAAPERFFLRFRQLGLVDGEITPTVTVNAPGLEQVECSGVYNNMRFYAITARRVVVVANGESGRLEYRSFDHRFASVNQRPTLNLSGGTTARTPSGVTYTFRNGAYTYRVSVSTRAPSARIDVLLNARLLQAETPLAFADVRAK
jgi:hypothetical protein